MKRWLALAALLSPLACLRSSHRAEARVAGPNRGAAAEAGVEVPHRGHHRQAHGTVGARVPAGRQLPRHRTARRAAHRVAERRGVGADRRRAARESGRRAELPRRRARSEFRAEPLRRISPTSRRRKAKPRRSGRSSTIYNEVWNKSLAERRVLDLGEETRRPRAPLGRQPPPRGFRRADRGPRRAPDRVRARRDDVRDGRRRVPLLRLRSRQHRRARLHGQSRRPPQLHGPRDPHQPGRHDPEGQPVARPRDRFARDVRTRPQGSRRRRAASRRPASSGSSTTGRRAATRSTSFARATTTVGPRCRTACNTTRASPTAGRTFPSAAARRPSPASSEPLYFWVPSIAPSGMAFYTGDLFPDWKGNLFVGAMAGKRLVRLVLDGEKVVAEERPAHRARLAHPRGAAGTGRRAVRARGRLAREGHAGQVTERNSRCALRSVPPPRRGARRESRKPDAISCTRTQRPSTVKRARQSFTAIVNPSPSRRMRRYG